MFAALEGHLSLFLLRAWNALAMASFCRRLAVYEATAMINSMASSTTQKCEAHTLRSAFIFAYAFLAALLEGSSSSKIAKSAACTIHGQPLILPMLSINCIIIKHLRTASS